MFEEHSRSTNIALSEVLSKPSLIRARLNFDTLTTLSVLLQKKTQLRMLEVTQQDSITHVADFVGSLLCSETFSPCAPVPPSPSSSKSTPNP